MTKKNIEMIPKRAPRKKYSIMVFNKLPLLKLGLGEKPSLCNFVHVLNEVFSD